MLSRTGNQHKEFYSSSFLPMHTHLNGYKYWYVILTIQF